MKFFVKPFLKIFTIMKQLDKKEAMRLLESFENEEIELENLVRNACSIIYSVAEQMRCETWGIKERLFDSITEITKAIAEINID